MLLDKINNANDIQKLSVNELEALAEELRLKITQTVSRNGGHLASNLGVVELSIALHYCLHFPEDKLIWDVGHQSYVHKILTGRKEQFDTLRQYKGLSGFPKRAESAADCFETGHSSTSISAGLGFVCAREIKKEKYTVVSVIGDGSLTGGLAFEALNNVSEIKSNYIIVLNDNEFSISANIGGVSKMLSTVRTADSYLSLKERVENKLRQTDRGDKLADKIKHTKSSIKQVLIPGKLFENMGITYLGPVDGHNIPELIRVLNRAKRLNHGVIVHVKTQKGRGYLPAEKSPDVFHGVGAFDIKSGLPKSAGGKTYSRLFAEAICELGRQDESIVAVSAAMSHGTGLVEFEKAFPERFFDVGIAEEHAVTFSAGLCTAGMKVVTAVFSTFLQRAFDQILHDVCMQSLPVVFAIDRAGLVGADGQTHHGIFDLSYLSLMPGMTVMAPKNGPELKEMLAFALREERGPVAIRYPRGTAYTGLSEYQAPIVYGKWEQIYKGEDVALIACGSMVETACGVRGLLLQHRRSCSLINARFIRPLDEEMLVALARRHSVFAVLEDNIKTGGLGEQIAEAILRLHLPVSLELFAVPDRFVEHGSVTELKEALGLDAESIAHRLLSGETK